MTDIDKLVTMSRWTRETIQALLDSFAPEADADDAREKKRRRIVEAAAALFVEQGYRKTTISEVAARAGVAKGTVYLHVKTKGELLLQAIIAEKRRYLHRMAPLFDESVAPKERLRRWLVLVLTLSHEMPLISRLVGRDQDLLLALEELPEGTMARSQMIQTEMVAELLDEAAGEHRWTQSELSDRARVLVGLIYSAVTISDERTRMGLSLQRFAEILTDVLVAGFTCPGAETPNAPGGDR